MTVLPRGGPTKSKRVVLLYFAHGYICFPTFVPPRLGYRRRDEQDGHTHTCFAAAACICMYVCYTYDLYVGRCAYRLGDVSAEERSLLPCKCTQQTRVVLETWREEKDRRHRRPRLVLYVFPSSSRKLKGGAVEVSALHNVDNNLL